MVSAASIFTVVLSLVTLASCASSYTFGEQPSLAANTAWSLVHDRPVVYADKNFTSFPINNTGFINETRGIAVCNLAQILFTDNGGKTWQLAKLPLTNGGFTSLEIMNNDMAWASGINMLRASSDGGNSWRELSDYGAVHASGNYLSFVSPMVGWYAVSKDSGSVHPLVITHDGGETWSPVAIPDDIEEKIMAISLLSESTGFILLISGKILRTDNAGVNWHSISLPITKRIIVKENLGAPVEALRFTSSLQGTVVLYFDKPRGFAVFDTEDGGKSWQEQILPHLEEVTIGNVFLSRDARYLTITDLNSKKIRLYRRQ
ncbi:MAG: hypothetical protein JW841_17425 [Deltaproteobacteria bacterium]|nr:hypothetical protein [Deltaproteobacteria bacterium]